jgi:hypothetical protein
MTKIPEITDDRRMKQLVLYLTAKLEGDPGFSAAKLNELLFYCDFTAYQQLGRSITGYSYHKLPSSPVPKAAQRASGSSALSAEELRLADQIIEDLWGGRTNEAKDYYPGFIGWQAAGLNEVIPYETVFLGNPSMHVREDEVEFCRQL